MPNLPPSNPTRLRELAVWYREYADRAHTPWVCEGRLRTADELDSMAALMEENHADSSADGTAAATLALPARCATWLMLPTD